jgi:hypothetical protein
MSSNYYFIGGPLDGKILHLPIEKIYECNYCPEPIIDTLADADEVVPEEPPSFKRTTYKEVYCKFKSLPSMRFYIPWNTGNEHSFVMKNLIEKYFKIKI